MKVEFWGAARTVTGSMHLIHYRDKKILLDCGLYQGKRKKAFQRNREMPFTGSRVDAVVLSHAHIDHSGNLPSLVRSGFSGPIYSTSATRDLAAYMLIDSAKIQQSDVKYVNRKRARKKQTPFEPLYMMEDAVQTLTQFRTVEYNHLFPIADGVQCRFHVAGHMLGAASVELVFDPEYGEGEPIRLVFSGDVGRPKVPILKDPETVKGANYLIMEATYGDRTHPKGGDAKKTLKEAAHQSYNAGGKLIIPAFSVGRTQELVYRLNQLAEAGELPEDMKVFVDSPLAVNATNVFREHPECYDHEMQQAILNEEDEDPLRFNDLHYIRKAEHSKALNTYDKPCIIISASGMCEAGRILHHLKNNISKPSTTVLFAGYQAPHTLGRILLEGTKDIVKIYGQEYEVKAKTYRLDGSSGHADQKELLEWARQTHQDGDLRKVALVHCEVDGAEAFKEKLEQRKIGPVIIPDRGESMEMV